MSCLVLQFNACKYSSLVVQQHSVNSSSPACHTLLRNPWEVTSRRCIQFELGRGTRSTPVRAMKGGCIVSHVFQCVSSV